MDGFGQEGKGAAVESRQSVPSTCDCMAAGVLRYVPSG